MRSATPGWTLGVHFQPASGQHRISRIGESKGWEGKEWDDKRMVIMGSRGLEGRQRWEGSLGGKGAEGGKGKEGEKESPINKNNSCAPAAIPWPCTHLSSLF